jgi:3-hydroxyisobutyrate dehydrogenase
MTTAIIGLGAMGLGMARNILNAGIALNGFDLSPDARQRFSDAGGTPCETPEAAVKGADLLLIMVVNPDQARSVLFETDVTKALTPDATVMLSSTVAPSDAREIAGRLADMGLNMLDAPVSGGQVGAEAGTLTVMVSGPKAAFDRAARVLDAVAGIVHRLGDEPGQAATYKVVHQLPAGVHLAVAAELMALGTKAGCDPQTLYDIVTNAAGNSWMMADRVPRMLVDNAPVASSVDIFIKDLGLVLQTGKDAGVPLPLSAVAYQMFTAASAMGHGREDDSRVVRAYEALMGQTLKDKT